VNRRYIVLFASILPGNVSPVIEFEILCSKIAKLVRDDSREYRSEEVHDNIYNIMLSASTSTSSGHIAHTLRLGCSASA
jgi:hypothetical protein